MSGYFYLATPYTKYEGGLDNAFHDACEQSALLIDEGVCVYSPIAHTHPIAIVGKLDPLDGKMWMDMDAPMLEAAAGLIVCKLKGWDESVGVGIEIEATKKAGKPIYFMDPYMVPVELLKE